MKKYLVIASVMLAASSCTKDSTRLNVDPKNPVIVPSQTLFSNAQVNFSDILTSTNVNNNIFRLITQQWTETTYIDESNYDISTRGQSAGWWNTFYRDVIKDLEESKTLLVDEPLIADDIKVNRTAIADIMQVYSYYYLVTLFGDIPYTEALDIANPLPKYDDAATVYQELLTRLDSDISMLDPNVESYGSADLLYGGDVESWMKFANSIKLKMGILLADVNSSLAKTTVESAYNAGVFTSNDDNAYFTYQTATPNTNPLWDDLVNSGRKDFVGADTYVDALKAVNDPRLPLYYTVDANGDYTGGLNGKSNNYQTFSKPTLTIQDPTFPGDLLDYAEVEFILAEAAARGYSVGGDAESHYNAGITASIEAWGGTPAQAANYLNQPSVAWSTAAGAWQQKIGTQAWFALYNRGYDAWTSQRRLDYPMLIAPSDAVSGYPVRFTYPVAEQNVNTPNYTAAASAVGGDEVETKLWFDK